LLIPRFFFFFDDEAVSVISVVLFLDTYLLAAITLRLPAHRFLLGPRRISFRYSE
jgi:hypothetical protein